MALKVVEKVCFWIHAAHQVAGTDPLIETTIAAGRCILAAKRWSILAANTDSA
jgi:hypothetical protein